MLIFSELEVAYLETLAADPASNNAAGRIYYNTADDAVKYYNAGDTAYYKLLDSNLDGGEIWIGDGGGVTAQALSGDITMDASGVTLIGPSKVTNAKLAGGILYSKLSLSDGDIPGAKVAAATSTTSGTIPTFIEWTTWAASFVTGGTNLTIATAKYARHGKTIFIQIDINAGAGGGTDATDVVVSLPVTPVNKAFGAPVANGWWNSSGTNYRPTSGFISAGSSNISFWSKATGSEIMTIITGTRMTSAAGFVRVNGFYEAAS